MKKSLNQQCLNEQEFKLKYPEYIKFLHPVCRNSNGYAWVEEIKTRCKELDEFYQDEHRTMERFNLVAPILYSLPTSRPKIGNARLKNETIKASKCIINAIPVYPRVA